MINIIFWLSGLMFGAVMTHLWHETSKKEWSKSKLPHETYSFGYGNDIHKPEDVKKLKNNCCSLIQDSSTFLLCVKTSDNKGVTATYNVSSEDLNIGISLIVNGWVEIHQQENLIVQANKILNQNTNQGAENK